MEDVNSRWLFRHVSQNMLPDGLEGGETVRETAYVTLEGVFVPMTEAGGSVMSPCFWKLVIATSRWGCLSSLLRLGSSWHHN